MWRAVFYKISASRKMSSKGIRKCHLQNLTLAQANKDPSISGVNFLGRRTFFVHDYDFSEKLKSKINFKFALYFVQNRHNHIKLRKFSSIMLNLYWEPVFTQHNFQ